MITTTDEAFTAAMRAAVADRGEDYVYPREWRMGYVPGSDELHGTCRYARPDRSGGACLIGEVLHRLGVPVEELAELDGGAGVPAHGAIAAHLAGVSRTVRLAASDAQSFQDTELSWGAALDAFERAVESGAA